MSDVLRIALIADIHHGMDVGTKLGTAALTLLQPFIHWVNDIRPDLVVELGDRINDLDQDADLRFTRDIAYAFSAIATPCVHILGNHDNYQLSREASEAAMQTSFASHSRDMKGYHLVFWNSAVDTPGPGGFQLASDDLSWLQADLAATELPTVIFTHVPLDNGSMIGNFYFEKFRPHGGHYEHGAAVRNIIEASGKVIACLAGHTHWNARSTIDGVHYITIHSLTESFTTHPYPTGAFGMLEIGDFITIEVLGRDPALYRLPIKPLGYHWQNLDRHYAPKPTQLSSSMTSYIAKQDA
jgi:3',5'-cyclic-AMP phosphodiesterase